MGQYNNCSKNGALLQCATQVLCERLVTAESNERAGFAEVASALTRAGERTMIAMMKGRGASFDRTQPHAEWVVRLINAKKKAEVGEGHAEMQVGQMPHLRYAAMISSGTECG